MYSGLYVWRERLTRVVARRCYHLLLARRGVRKWRAFVAKIKYERKVEQEKMEKAICHYNMKIW